MWRAMLIGMGAVVLAADGQDTARLNDLLTERRAVNIQYAADNVSWAQEDGGDYAGQWSAHEAAMGAAWDDLLGYAIEHDDVALKSIVLRLEYHDELRSVYESLSYAETDEERAELQKEVADFEAKLKDAEPEYETPAAAAPATKEERRGGAAPY